MSQAELPKRHDASFARGQDMSLDLVFYLLNPQLIAARLGGASHEFRRNTAAPLVMRRRT
eukprot:11530430-Heterocapsa_arctica.AAC.1